MAVQRERAELLKGLILRGTGSLESDNTYRGALKEVEDTIGFDVEFLSNEIEEAQRDD